MSPLATSEQDPAPAPTPLAPSPSLSTAPDTMIRVEGLGKTFKIYAHPADRLAEWLTGNRVRRHADFWAVRDVTFQVRRGECLGIIGANGSGKSTLLKLITGSLYPTEGSASVHAKSLSLLDLGSAMNPLLPGGQNIINAARSLGFPAAYARDAMAEIREFAELGDFFDRPVGLYSAGMRVRLSFSMFACFRPDILIVDEALSVGDVFFQQKCAARLRTMLDAGLTMLFVSHDQGAVLNLCDRAILMEKGRAVFEGDPAEALSRYSGSLRTDARFRTAPAPAQRPAHGAAHTDVKSILNGDVIGDRSAARFGTGHARIVACRVTDAAGSDAMHAFMGEPLVFHVLVESIRPLAHPRVAVQLVDRFSNLLFAGGTRMLGHALPALAPGDRLVVRIEIGMELAPGEYSFSLSVSEPPDDDPESGIVHDQIPALGPLRVALDRQKPRPFHGAARLPVRIDHTAVPGAAG